MEIPYFFLIVPSSASFGLVAPIKSLFRNTAFSCSSIITTIGPDDKYAGCSVHFVSAKIDSGKIIMQKKVKIRKNDTVDSLSKKVLKKEHQIYPSAIRKIFS